MGRRGRVIAELADYREGAARGPTPRSRTRIAGSERTRELPLALGARRRRERQANQVEVEAGRTPFFNPPRDGFGQPASVGDGVPRNPDLVVESHQIRRGRFGRRR